jgi:uncharacterized membrane protein (UPF0182 family)
MTNPAVFYNKEESMAGAGARYRAQRAPMRPYCDHDCTAAPDRIRADPAVHAACQDNLSAWMVARSARSLRPHARVSVPKAEDRVAQADRRALNQDQIISPQITLWNQQGSEE